MAWCYDQQVATANRRTVDEDRSAVVCLHQELVARPLAEAAHGAYLKASTRIRFSQPGEWRAPLLASGAPESCSPRRHATHHIARASNLQVARAVAIN